MRTLSNRSADATARVRDASAADHRRGANYYGCGRVALPRAVLVSLAMAAFMLAIAGNTAPVGASECPTGLSADQSVAVSITGAAG